MNIKLDSKQNPLISVVIRTYNEGKFLEKLLSTIQSQNMDNGSYETIIVDSGSTDNTLEIAEKYPTRVVQISPEKFSFGYSLNTGIKAAKGKYVALISAHCCPTHNDWLDYLVEPFDDEKVALVYGQQRGNHLNKFSEKQIFKKMFPDSSHPKQQSPFCNNANLAIRRSLWQTTPYDEELTGLEDLDWANKAIKQGYYLYYNAGAKVAHIHQETWRTVFLRHQREAIALKRIFPDASFSFFDLVRLTSSNIFLDYCRAALFERKIKNIWEIFLFRLIQFGGTYRGHHYKKAITDQAKKHFYYPRPVQKKEESQYN